MCKYKITIIHLIYYFDHFQFFFFSFHTLTPTNILRERMLNTWEVRGHRTCRVYGGSIHRVNTRAELLNERHRLNVVVRRWRQRWVALCGLFFWFYLNRPSALPWLRRAYKMQPISAHTRSHKSYNLWYIYKFKYSRQIDDGLLLFDAFAYNI